MSGRKWTGRLRLKGWFRRRLQREMVFESVTLAFTTAPVWEDVELEEIEDVVRSLRIQNDQLRRLKSPPPAGPPPFVVNGPDTRVPGASAPVSSAEALAIEELWPQAPGRAGRRNMPASQSGSRQASAAPTTHTPLPPEAYAFDPEPVSRSTPSAGGCSNRSEPSSSDSCSSDSSSSSPSSD